MIVNIANVVGGSRFTHALKMGHLNDDDDDGTWHGSTIPGSNTASKFEPFDHSIQDHS